jgi:hypothetical protein
MKNLTVLGLAFVLVAVLLFAGVNGVLNDHATGPFFIFLGACTAAGLSLDVTRVVREYTKRSKLRKLRP